MGRPRGHHPAHIAPLRTDDWGDEEREAISVLPDEMRPPPGVQINVLNLMAHHPALSKAVLEWSLYLRFGATLDNRQRELLVLRTMWLHQADSELRRHARLARRYGFTEDELVAVTVGAGAPSWSPEEAVLLAVADEAFEDRYVSAETWSKLEAFYSTRQIMDAVFLVGTYAMFALAYGSMGLQPDDGLDPYPVPFSDTEEETT